MRLSGRHGDSAKGEVQRSARIMQHSNRITHVRRCTHDSVDAHVAHRTDDDNIFDIKSIQLLLEVRVSEGIDVLFSNHGFLTHRRYSGLYLRSVGPFGEYRGTLIIGFMAYVENRNTGTRAWLITRLAFATAASIPDNGNLPVGRYSFCRSTTTRPRFITLSNYQVIHLIFSGG